MKTKISLILLVSVAFLFQECKKEDVKNETPQEVEEAYTPLEFQELKAGRTGIALGQTTTITAVVSGTNLSYAWQASSGTLVGEGNEVTYGSTCASCVGMNTITCSVTDSKGATATKSIQVTIK